MQPAVPDRQQLIELANTRMPYGRYEGRLLIELPEPYLAWYAQKGHGEVSGVRADSLRVNGVDRLAFASRVWQEPCIDQDVGSPLERGGSIALADFLFRCEFHVCAPIV